MFKIIIKSKFKKQRKNHQTKNSKEFKFKPKIQILKKIIFKKYR
jgi:hypothetical protein